MRLEKRDEETSLSLGSNGTWAKVFIGCAVTAILNIFASGRQVGAFEERLTWMKEKQAENSTCHENLRSEFRASDEKLSAQMERMETILQSLQVSLAREHFQNGGK